MKKFNILFLMLLLAAMQYAGSPLTPEKMRYQVVVRNCTDKLTINQLISMTQQPEPWFMQKHTNPQQTSTDWQASKLEQKLLSVELSLLSTELLVHTLSKQKLTLQAELLIQVLPASS